MDKLQIEALENTLRALVAGEINSIPTLRMIAEPLESIRSRAERMAETLFTLAPEIVPGESAIGGGSTPDQVLPTYLIRLNVQPVVRFERSLRLGNPPVIGRIEKDHLLLDLRTVAPEEEAALATAVIAAVSP